MFGEISIWGWMGAAIMFGIGGGAGFFISRQIKDKRTLELEEKLASARNELAGYRGDVNQHFLKTSLLLGKLTNNYREVYEHLATGAQKLCNEKPNTPKLDLPDTKILPSKEIAKDETPAIELAAETMVEVSVEASTENTKQTQSNSTDEKIMDEASVASESTAEENVEPSAVVASKEETGQEAGRPAPEDIQDEDSDEDVHLGAESAPSVDTELHKTHPSIH
jgi:uncharacterized membrane-anchored protein YhcB (DUF1043 family)